MISAGMTYMLRYLQGMRIITVDEINPALP